MATAVVRLPRVLRTERRPNRLVNSDLQKSDAVRNNNNLTIVNHQRYQPAGKQLRPLGAKIARLPCRQNVVASERPHSSQQEGGGRERAATTSEDELPNPPLPPLSPRPASSRRVGKKQRNVTNTVLRAPLRSAVQRQTEHQHESPPEQDTQPTTTTARKSRAPAKRAGSKRAENDRVEAANSKEPPTSHPSKRGKSSEKRRRSTSTSSEENNSPKLSLIINEHDVEGSSNESMILNRRPLANSTDQSSANDSINRLANVL